MSELITPPVTLGNWKVRQYAPPERPDVHWDGEFCWSIEQPDGTERARFASAQAMAEHYAMMTEYCDRLKEEIERLENETLPEYLLRKPLAWKEAVKILKVAKP